MDKMNTTRISTGGKGVKGVEEGGRVSAPFRPIPVFLSLPVGTITK